LHLLKRRPKGEEVSNKVAKTMGKEKDAVHWDRCSGKIGKKMCLRKGGESTRKFVGSGEERIYVDCNTESKLSTTACS